MGVNFMKSLMRECDSTLCLHYFNKYDKEIVKNCSLSEKDKVIDGIDMYPIHVYMLTTKTELRSLRDGSEFHEEYNA